MFAQHKDDKKKVEKALEVSHFPHGRVMLIFFLTVGSKVNMYFNFKLHPQSKK